MAFNSRPTISDDKLNYFRDQLTLELMHMFKWEGLPDEVPQDYMEHLLITEGNALFYYTDEFGHDVNKSTTIGYNRHERPIMARTFITSQVPSEQRTFERNIKYLSDGASVIPTFNKLTDGVLIHNMPRNYNVQDIIEHFAKRLALTQQAFDTNLLWMNVPYIFLADNTDMELSIKKMFSKIFEGEPLIVADKMLFSANKDKQGVPTGIPYIGKELLDTQNEIMMKFRERVGFNTAGVDKAERVNTLEIKSNDQHTETVLQIMLRQREIACEAINAFFGLSVTVGLSATDQKGGGQYSDDDDGTTETFDIED